MQLKRKVQTVLGPVEADDLGIVLPHEHFFVDASNYLIEPSDSEGKELAHQPVCLENLGWVHSHKLMNLDNLQLTDEKMMIREAMRFKKAGGSTIVDVTPNDIGRNPSGLVHVAQATGLNVIMGTAYYVEQSYRPEMNMDSKTEGDIAEEFVRDIEVGVGDSGVRAGIIGELGCSWPITNNERKVLRGAAIAQQRTGVAISVHPGVAIGPGWTEPGLVGRPAYRGTRKEGPIALGEEGPLEIVNVLIGAGADPTRIIIDHISGTMGSHTKRCKLAKTSCYLEWDYFGYSRIWPPDCPDTVAADLPSDSECIRQIIQLMAEGYLNQILISHDVCMKDSLSCFGGQGYSHILNTVIPIMRQKGITEQQIHALIVENPKRVLSGV